MNENLIGKICIYNPFQQCDLCVKCAEPSEQNEIFYPIDYEPSGEEIEKIIEEQTLLEELEADNL